MNCTQSQCTILEVCADNTPWKHHPRQDGKHHPRKVSSCPSSFSLFSDNHWQAVDSYGFLMDFYTLYFHIMETHNVLSFCLTSWLSISTLRSIQVAHDILRWVPSHCVDGDTSVCLYTHSLMDIRAVSSLGILQIKQLWKFVYNVCMDIYALLFPLVKTTKKVTNCFPKWLYHFHPLVAEEFQLPPALGRVSLFNFSHFHSVWWGLTAVLIYIFLMTKDVEYLSRAHLFVIYVSSLVRYLFKCFDHFFTIKLFSFYWILKNITPPSYFNFPCWKILFYFILVPFFFGHTACGILVPQPGIQRSPSAVKAQSPKHRVLTTGPPGNSQGKILN